MELTVHGRRAFAYTGGKAFDATLPCVMFIHGALHDHSVWTLLARWCAHHGRSVLAVDLPGHGRSGGPPLDNVQALAEWALAVMDAAGVQPAAAVGHSMGSLIALEIAALAPERITRLAMLGTAYPMQVSQVLLDAARDAPLQAIDQVNAFSHSGIASKPSFPGPGMWLHGANRALMRRMQRGQAELNLFHHDFQLCDRYTNGLEAAAKVLCPSHLVLGRHDQMTPPKAADEIASVLKARIHLLASGHALMQEAPEATLQALIAALA